ncbi:IS66 family transposase [Roseobacter sp. EG26]|uniref:IS66 family transposase n=1 Tax=Roseobacter sp. EG26 TaxID=3412477 RepID=UPI003CE4E3BE
MWRLRRFFAPDRRGCHRGVGVQPGPGLLAHVLVGKYCDHLPLDRQSKIFAREKVDLHRSTLTEG